MQEQEVLRKFQFLYEEFKKASKRVLINRPLSKKESKVFEYIVSLCKSYNDLVIYIAENNNPCSTKLANKFASSIGKCKLDLEKCGIKLKYSFVFSQDRDLLAYPLIADASITEYCDAQPDFSLTKTRSLPDDLNKLSFDSENLHKDSSHLSLEGKFSLEKYSIKTSSSSLTINSKSDTSSTLTKNLNSEICKTSSGVSLVTMNNMATPEEKRTFINMCASIIRQNYDGNPLALESFIDKINLIEEISEQNLIPTLIRFILSKLEGKARESVAPQAVSLDEIKQSLRNRIKPDNSKVIAGKITSVRVVNGDYAAFAKQVEELADALERSLVAEGITQSKAHEMAVEQTVSICRSNSRTELVRSILASSTFTDPKDVIAKMIIELSNETVEKNVLRLNGINLNSNRVNNNNQGFNNYRNYNNRDYHHRYNNNNNNHNRISDQRHNNDYRRNNNNSRYNSRNFNNSRGNFHNNDFRGNQNYSSSHNNRMSESRQFNNNPSHVRSLNADNHQQETPENHEI